MQRWQLLPLVVVIGCGGATGPGDIRVGTGTEFDLALGQSATVEGAGLWIEFEAVPEDSRCPPMAFCFWAGDARVELEVKAAGSPGWKRRDVALHTNPGVGPSVVRYGVYALRLVDLQPEFRAGEHPDYVVTLRVDPRGTSTYELART